MEQFFFDSWASVSRTLAIGVLAYVGLILMLRLSGKRTLAKMNSFDLVVTVALGSTLATVLLTKEVPLADGLLAFALLIVLQFSVTWLSVRSNVVRRIARGEPTLLVHRGTFLKNAMKDQRVTSSEVLQAIRSQGIADLADVEGVVIETDGTFSVIRWTASISHSSIAELR
jgi:uncharacterized membrane protein YcaP (DUF421 family)